MALPTVKINSATGSDTAASGAGPATALSGTGASTNGTTTVTLLADNPDLSGVPTDGSAVMWVGSSANRQFSGITGVNNTAGVKTVSVVTAYTQTESSRNWGIGGKRATIQGSIRIGIDCAAGWTIDLQTDDSSLTGAFVFTPTSNASGTQTTFTSTKSPKALITQATNSTYGIDTKGATNILISNLSLICTAGTKGNGIGPSGSASATNVTISQVTVDGFKYGILTEDEGNNVRTTGIILDRCVVKNCSNRGIYQQLPLTIKIDQCYIHDNGVVALIQGLDNSVTGSIFANNVGGGLNIVGQTNASIVVEHCNFTGSTGTNSYGLLFNATHIANLSIKNNIFWGNAATGGYGLSGQAGALASWVTTNNAFGGNTSDIGASSTLTTGMNAVTLTTSPFVSSSDYGLNGNAGGGAACKGAASIIPNASANTPGDIGAIPSGGGAAGASGGTPHLAGRGGGLAG